MQGDTGPRSAAESFFRSCLLIFGGVILLTLAIEMAKSIWWVFVLVAVLITVILLLRWWWRRRDLL